MPNSETSGLRMGKASWGRFPTCRWDGRLEIYPILASAFASDSFRYIAKTFLIAASAFCAKTSDPIFIFLARIFGPASRGLAYYTFIHDSHSNSPSTKSMMSTYPTIHCPEVTPQDTARPAISATTWANLTGILEVASKQLFQRAQETPLDDNLIREAKALFDCAMKLERLEQAADKGAGGSTDGAATLIKADRIPADVAATQVSAKATAPADSTVRIAGFSPEPASVVAVQADSRAAHATATCTNAGHAPAPQSMSRPNAVPTTNPAQLRKAQRKARRAERRKAQGTLSTAGQAAARNGDSNKLTPAVQEELKRLASEFNFRDYREGNVVGGLFSREKWKELGL